MGERVASLSPEDRNKLKKANELLEQAGVPDILGEVFEGYEDKVRIRRSGLKGRESGELMGAAWRVNWGGDRYWFWGFDIRMRVTGELSLEANEKAVNEQRWQVDGNWSEEERERLKRALIVAKLNPRLLGSTVVGGVV